MSPNFRSFRRRPNSRGGRKLFRNRANISKTLSEKFNGSSKKTNPDPSSTVDRPWNSVVLAINATSPGVVTVANLAPVLRSQLALPTGGSLELRFQSLKAWDLTGGRLGVSIFDFEGQTHRTQHDEPGRNHWASCSLVWSSALTANTLPETVTVAVFQYSTSTTATPLSTLFHIHLLWRFAGQPVSSGETATIENHY